MAKQATTLDLQKELDELLLWFESDQLDIDLALKKFERGQQLIQELQARLQAAENTIQIVTKK